VAGTKRKLAVLVFEGFPKAWIGRSVEQPKHDLCEDLQFCINPKGFRISSRKEYWRVHPSARDIVVAELHISGNVQVFWSLSPPEGFLHFVFSDIVCFEVIISSVPFSASPALRFFIPLRNLNQVGKVDPLASAWWTAFNQAVVVSPLAKDIPPFTPFSNMTMPVPTKKE